jgi:hypothetical protein
MRFFKLNDYKQSKIKKRRNQFSIENFIIILYPLYKNNVIKKLLTFKKYYFVNFKSVKLRLKKRSISAIIIFMPF